MKIWKDKVENERRHPERIIQEVRNNSTGSSSDVRKSLLLNVSSRTVCRRLNESGLKNYVCTRKPLVSKQEQKEKS